MTFDIPTLFKLESLWPRISKAIETVKRIQSDPDVLDAIALEQEIVALLTAPGPEPHGDH